RIDRVDYKEPVLPPRQPGQLEDDGFLLHDLQQAFESGRGQWWRGREVPREIAVPGLKDDELGQAAPREGNPIARRVLGDDELAAVIGQRLLRAEEALVRSVPDPRRIA